LGCQGARCKVQEGARCKKVQGARRCKVQEGARRCKKVQEGARCKHHSGCSVPWQDDARQVQVLCTSAPQVRGAWSILLLADHKRNQVFCLTIPSHAGTQAGTQQADTGSDKKETETMKLTMVHAKSFEKGCRPAANMLLFCCVLNMLLF
jgi:hypothetical protein